MELLKYPELGICDSHTTSSPELIRISSQTCSAGLNYLSLWHADKTYRVHAIGKWKLRGAMDAVGLLDMGQLKVIFMLNNKLLYASVPFTWLHANCTNYINHSFPGMHVHFQNVAQLCNAWKYCPYGNGPCLMPTKLHGNWSKSDMLLLNKQQIWHRLAKCHKCDLEVTWLHPVLSTSSRYG